MYFHTTKPGPWIDDFQTALVKAVVLAQENGTNEVAIAVHQKGNLTGVIEEAIGEAAVKQLLKPAGYIDFEGVRLFVITEKIRSGFRHGVIVAAHVSTKFMEKLTADYRTTDVVYVPWQPDELTAYLQKHTSTPL